jgi:multiple sugar transport system substrate-binding protein
MEINGNWNFGELKRYAPDLDYGLAPVPVPQGLDHITWSGIWVNGMPRQAKHKEAAWELLKFFTTVECQVAHALVASNLPTLKEARESYLAATEFPVLADFLDLLATSYTEPPIPEWAQAWDEHLAAEQEALYGRKTPQEALDDANAKVQASIDARIERYSE